MEIIVVSDRDEQLVNKLVDMWEKSVKATHLFLTDDGISEIKQYVPQEIKAVGQLAIVTDKSGLPIAFMGVENKKLEMLFVHPNYIRRGLGRQLVEYGIDYFGISEVTVNEQNPDAVAFYEHMGFKIYKRTDLDEAGMPYPLLYMKL